MELYDKVKNDLYAITRRSFSLSKNLTVSGYNGNTIACLVRDDGSIENPHHFSCFGWVRSATDGFSDFKKAKISHVGFFAHHCSRLSDDYKVLSSYIMFRSPWKHVFEGVDFDQFIKEGVVLVSTEHYTNQLFGGLIALRNASEHWCNGSTGVFRDLVEAGADEHLAFLLKYNVSSSNSQEPHLAAKGVCREYTVGFSSPHNSDQSAIQPRVIGISACQKFVSGKFAHSTRTPRVNTIVTSFGQHKSGELSLPEMIKEAATMDLKMSSNVFKKQQTMQMLPRPWPQAIEEGVMICNNLGKMLSKKKDVKGAA